MARLSAGIIFVVLLALFSTCLSDSNVVTLTPDNFDKIIDGSKHALVEFYAPWCGHCKSLAPEYEKVGDAFAKSSTVVVAKVDADAHKDLASKFDIHGFPTLKWFPKGSKTTEDFDGQRTADGIVEFINQKSGAKGKVKSQLSAVVVLTPANFDQVVLDTKKDVLVEFYAPWCGHCKRLAPDYEKVAMTFQDEPGVVIAKVDCDAHKEISEKYGISGFPTLKWFPKNNKDGLPYEGGRDPQSFVSFINDKTGTARLLGGGLSPSAGRIKELDSLSSEYVLESAENRQKLFEQATNLAAGYQESDKAISASYYVKVMKLINEKGSEYASTESTRLQRMLDTNSVKADKMTEFKKRINILQSFLGLKVSDKVDEDEEAPEEEPDMEDDE